MILPIGKYNQKGIRMNNVSVIKKLKLGITALVILSSISSMINYMAYKKVSRAYNEFRN